MKFISEEEIIAMSIKEIEDITNDHKEIHIKGDSISIVQFMIRNHDKISNFEEKFICFINHFKTHNVQSSKNFVAIACNYAKEEPLRILLESGWDINLKMDTGVNAALFQLFHTLSDRIFRYNAKIHVLEEKQERIFHHLLRHGIDLDVYKENKYGISLYNRLTTRKKENYFKWVKSYKGELNETQKRHWKAFRLKQLV